MQFDLGLGGVGLLLVISLGFGLVAQFLARARTNWMWLAATAGWFVGGLFASEVVWAGATQAELQPIIDGLAFDESLLGGFIAGSLVAIATWLVTGGRRLHGPTAV